MISLPKEELVGGLQRIVLGAHSTNKSVIGVILYGSRSKGKERVDSDVDLIYVFDERALGINGLFSTGITQLDTSIECFLSQYTIKRHRRNFVITKRNLIKAANKQSPRREYIRCCRFLDCHSLYIGVGNEQINILLELVFKLSKRKDFYQRAEDEWWERYYDEV